MAFVIGIYDVERFGRLLQRREAEHALAIGQEHAWSGVLHHDGFATGQVASRAVTHPCILKLHTRRFGATKFAARVLDVRLILFGGGRDLARVTNSPAALFQLLPFLQVSWIFHEQRQFKGLPRQPRQIGKLEERDPLRVLVLFRPVQDPIGRIPRGNRGERFATGIEAIRPMFQADGWPDVYPAQTAIGNLAAWSAHILASGEVQVMWRDLQLPTADPELEKAWIDSNQRGALEAPQQRRAE